MELPTTTTNAINNHNYTTQPKDPTNLKPVGTPHDLEDDGDIWVEKKAFTDSDSYFHSYSTGASHWHKPPPNAGKVVFLKDVHKASPWIKSFANKLADAPTVEITTPPKPQRKFFGYSKGQPVRPSDGFDVAVIVPKKQHKPKKTRKGKRHYRSAPIRPADMPSEQELAYQNAPIARMPPRLRNPPAHILAKAKEPAPSTDKPKKKKKGYRPRGAEIHPSPYDKAMMAQQEKGPETWGLPPPLVSHKSVYQY